MAAGGLNVAGNADPLMQATFQYNVEQWQPQVEYSLDGSQGTLLVEQEGEDFPVGENWLTNGIYN